MGEAVTLVTEAVQVSVTSFSSDLTLTAPVGGAECGGRGLGGARTRLVRSVRPWGIQHYTLIFQVYRQQEIPLENEACYTLMFVPVSKRR